MLANVEPLRPTVRALVQYAGQHIGMTFGRLSDYGVDDLQATLASLIGRISQLANAKLVPGRAGTVPSAVKASLGLGIVAGGLARRRRMTAEEVMAARALSNLGAQKDQPGESESKSLKRLRGRLRKLQAQLPEQRT